MWITLLLVAAGSALVCYGTFQLASVWCALSAAARRTFEKWVAVETRLSADTASVEGTERAPIAARLVAWPGPRDTTAARATLRMVGVAGGAALVVSGMILMRQPSGGSLAIGALQHILQSVFDNPLNVARGTVLIVAGAILFAWGMSLQPAPTRIIAAHRAAARTPHFQRAVGLASLGTVLYVVALVRVISGSGDYLSGILLVVALATFSWLALVLSPPGDALLSRREFLALCAAATAAAVFYLHDADNWFYSWIGDEWSFYTLARFIAGGGQMNIFQQSGVYDIHPVMDSVYQAVTIRLFGNSVVAWRASGAAATVLTALPLYVLTRSIATRLAAGIAVGFFLSAHVLIAYAHIGYNQPDALAPFVIALALYVVGRRSRLSGYLFLAGIAAGLGWYTLFTARPAIFLLLLAFVIDRPPSVRRAAKEVSVVIAGFALVILPLFIENGSTTVTALIVHDQLSSGGLASVQTRVSENAAATAYSFLYSQQVDNHYVSGALFDTISSFFLVLGTALLLAWRNVWGRLAVLWFWLLIVPLGSLYYAAHLNTTRLYILTPIAAAIAGIGAAAILESASVFIFSRHERRFIVLAATGAVLTVCVSNLYVFYRVVPATMAATPNALTMKEVLANPDDHVLLTGGLAGELLPPLDAYGLTGRVSAVPDMAEASHLLAGIRGRHTIALSAAPILPLPRGDREFDVWDSAHVRYIVVTEPQR